MRNNDCNATVAAITGGARGFGKAFGIALAKLQAHVVLVDLDGVEAERAGITHLIGHQFR